MYVNNDIDYLKFMRDKKVYIFGAGKRGCLCCKKMSKMGYDIVAFIDNDSQKYSQKIEGKPVLSLEEFIAVSDKRTIAILCGYEVEKKEQMYAEGVYNCVAESQIDFGEGESYYDEAYFEFQRKMGEFGGKIKKAIFDPYICESDTIVEFGSGGGYLLNALSGKEKVGIEINDTARENAATLGIVSVKHISDIADDYADVIISTSVLEHVENPLGVLRELYCKLKDGGKIVFHVPNESCDTEYTRSEINNHLYTWNCLNIGNLFKAAGFFVKSVEKLQEVWPSNYMQIEKEVSPELFEEICKIGGRAAKENRCLIVAYK